MQLQSFLTLLLLCYLIATSQTSTGTSLEIQIANDETRRKFPATNITGDINIYHLNWNQHE
jgi:hypothetical protein